VNKKGKYKQEKKEASYKKQKEASNKGNTHINNLYTAPNLQCLLGRIRPRRPHRVAGKITSSVMNISNAMQNAKKLGSLGCLEITQGHFGSCYCHHSMPASI